MDRVTSNRLLSRLSKGDLSLLEPSLEAVELAPHEMLEQPNRRIKNVYFIERGMASVIANRGAEQVEIAVIGREGMTGLAVVMDTDRSPQRTVMQVEGFALRISAPELRKTFSQSVTLRKYCLHYAHAFLIQTGHTALANAAGTLEERVARRLLMAHDRVDGDELPVTHEFIGMMLGAARPGVTLVMQELERRGLIARRRGSITIIDRAGLEESSGGTYGPPEAEFQRLFG
jgi:CRP-like cAMP-binding protein